jgi:hypothetical protein
MKPYNLYIFVFTLMFTAKVRSQIGIGTASISNGVMLQLEAADKGVILPRIALVARSSTSPLSSAIPNGTMIFNTATAGNYPDNVTPGLHWWNSTDQQWININTNKNNIFLEYTNAESSTNYNSTTQQNVKIFGNKIINDNSSIYQVNTANQTVQINRKGLYSISALLSFDRLDADEEGRLSLSAQLYINNAAAGTEQVISPGYTTSINDNRGLFSHSFTEYLEINEGDIISLKIKKTTGTYSGDYGTAQVRFLKSGDSSIAIYRIR